MTYGLPECGERSPTHGPALRLVPEPVPPLGRGVLPEPEAFDQPMLVRRVHRVTHDVVSLVLQPTRPGALCFLPGQYVVLTVEVEGRRVERCYTISSPPTRPHLLTITTKLMPGGALSPVLHSLAPGTPLDVRGPYGEFTVAARPTSRRLLLSAGSGITPTLATLRTMADLAEDTDLVVVHCARTPTDLACRAELEAIAQALPAVRLHWVVERADAGWSGPVGRIDARLLRTLVPDAAARETYTCGPPAYMAAARAALQAAGAEPSRCHEESFVLAETPSMPVAVPPPTAPDADEVTVRFTRSGVEVRSDRRTTVLTSAVRAGVRLPSSCESGLCGTCKSTLLAGEVEMTHQGGIRPREIAQRQFLPCCSTPAGDLEVDA